MCHLGYYMGPRLSCICEAQVEPATSIIVQHSCLLVTAAFFFCNKASGPRHTCPVGLSELLRHRIRHYVVCCTILLCHLVRRDGLALAVVANVGVLSALVRDGILAEVNAPAVIDLDAHRPAQDRLPQPLRCQTLHELVAPNTLLGGLT